MKDPHPFQNVKSSFPECPAFRRVSGEPLDQPGRVRVVWFLLAEVLKKNPTVIPVWL